MCKIHTACSGIFPESYRRNLSEIDTAKAYAEELPQNNLPYSLSFSPSAPLKNQLHSPLCARFSSNALKEKSYALYKNYFFAVSNPDKLDKTIRKFCHFAKKLFIRVKRTNFIYTTKYYFKRYFNIKSHRVIYYIKKEQYYETS